MAPERSKRKKESSPPPQKTSRPQKTSPPPNKNAKQVKKKRPSPVEEHGGGDGGSSSRTSKRPRQNPNPKNLQRNPPVSTPTIPTPAVPTLTDPTPMVSIPTVPTHSGSEETQSAEVTRSQNPPRASTKDPPVTPLSGSSTRGAGHSSEQGENPEEIGSNHGDTHISQEHNVTEGEEVAGGAIKPHKFYFQPTEYGKSCKLSSRCHQKNFIKLMKDFHALEKKWFYEHPQFKHLFHMEYSSRRKVMGLWMLLLRTVKVDKKRQAWFVVNGVPIRYSIREHGLLSGLYCHTYPENYESIGSLRFAKKYFQQPPKKKGEDPPELKVTPADVLKKLKKMKYDDSHDRLRMAVLYFLATVIFQKSRYGTPIDHFLLRMVNDLRLCHTFPWGRFTFDDSLKEIKHMVKHFKGKIPAEKASWTFPGFINPLEILAFESIQVLKNNFREDVEKFDDSCPRMCKSRFLGNGSSGYALEEIYEKLGETKDISNTLKPNGSESDLLVEIFDDGLWDDFEVRDDGDEPDTIVDGWNKIIVHDRVKILWEDLYMMDVNTREKEHESERICEESEGPRVCEETEAGSESLEIRLAQLEASMKVRDDRIAQLEASMKVKDGRITQLEERMKSMENNHNLSDEFGNMNEFFYHETGGGQENGQKEPEKDGENEPELMAQDDADKETTKEGDIESELVAEDDTDKEAVEIDADKEAVEIDADKEATKECENEPELMAKDDADKESMEIDADKEATKEDENEPELMAKDDADKESMEVDADKETTKESNIEPELMDGDDIDKEAVEIDAVKEATKECENEPELMAKDDADKQPMEVDADKEATKEGEHEPEQMDGAGKEATKVDENEPEHAVQENAEECSYTLEVMVAAAEKAEKEAVEKEAVEKEASEKEPTNAEEYSPKKTKRVPKPSRMKKSPYVEK